MAPARLKISLIWPGAAIATRNLRGLITASDAPNSKPLPLKNVQVQLLNLRTAQVLASTYTNRDGYYDFVSFAPGLYVIRFNENQDPSSRTDDMAVEIAPHAVEEHMPILEMDKVCGNGLSRIAPPPDQALFDRGMSAQDEGRFDVASITLQTLVNTYPDCEPARKAEIVLQDPRIVRCRESWNSDPECSGGQTTTGVAH